MHFTLKLASDVLGKHKRWGLGEVKESLDRKVWFNLTGATDGDILFLGNYFHNCNKRGNMALARTFLGYYSFGGALRILLNDCRQDFDFTPYI